MLTCVTLCCVVCFIPLRIIIIIFIIIIFFFFYVFFDVTLLPVFYTNREPFGKNVDSNRFCLWKKKKESYYCYWRSICQIMIMITNFYQ